MQLAGIICEYNPIHEGHIHHIKQTRQKTNCDGIVCLMSGNFVQRGEAAIAGKYLRAKSAIQNGADLVIELPVMYSLSPAETFAYGAVKILSEFQDIKFLSFGSESGSIDTLLRSAQILSKESEDFEKLMSCMLDKGFNYPSAYDKAINEYYGGETAKILSTPNNVLGIEYLKALSKLKTNITPVTIKREGSVSSSNIRKDILNGSLKHPYKCPRFDDKALCGLLRYKSLTGGIGSLKSIHGVTEGIEYRIIETLAKTNDYEQIITSIKTKRYTLAKIKRILLNYLLGVTEKDIACSFETEPYFNILAVKEKSGLLSRLPKNSITKYADYENLSDKCKAIIDFDILAENLYALLTNQSTGKFFSQKLLKL